MCDHHQSPLTPEHFPSQRRTRTHWAVCPIPPALGPRGPQQPQACLCLQSLASSGCAYVPEVSFGIASLTLQNVFRVLPRCGMSQHFVSIDHVLCIHSSVGRHVDHSWAFVFNLIFQNIASKCYLSWVCDFPGSSLNLAPRGTSPSSLMEWNRVSDRRKRVRALRGTEWTLVGREPGRGDNQGRHLRQEHAGLFEEQEGLRLARVGEQGEMERLGKGGGMNGGKWWDHAGFVAGRGRCVSCEPDGSHWLTWSW